MRRINRIQNMRRLHEAIGYNPVIYMDFFNDMVVNTTLAQTQATAGTVPAFPAYLGSSNQSTSSTSSVSGTVNSVSGVYTQYTYQYVNLQGVVQTVGAAANNFVRYAEYPGQRIFKTVKFDVNGNPLDEYGAEAMMYHQKFRVTPNKFTGYKRLVGQEVPVDCYSNLMSIAGTSDHGAATVNLVDVKISIDVKSAC